MNPDIKSALAGKLLAMADDELILGQRNSEWCGHAPILEEDIAFANIALDEIGHAGLWYGLLADLLEQDPDTYPDEMVFRRPPGDFRNSQMVELPVEDWAFTIVRQFLFDQWEQTLLDGLTQSSYIPIRDVASKVVKEEIYHLRHSRAWVIRLGLGTEESHRRMQNALTRLWRPAAQLTVPLADEHRLYGMGYFPKMEAVAAAWDTLVREIFLQADLEIPGRIEPEVLDRAHHTRHHEPMILELQSVVRQFPEASW